MERNWKKVLGVGLASLLGLLLVLFLCGVAVGYLSASGAVDGEAVLPWVTGGIATAAMIGGFAVSIVWMRSIDEAAQEAHKSAWFWGGSAGMALGGVAVCLATLPQAASVHIPSWLGDRTDPAAYAATGASGMLLLMLAGYTLAWAWWWLRRS